jgi:hypothetical protein
MDLQWISRIRDLVDEANQANVENMPAVSPDRILFIGFDRVPGYQSHRWTDWDWPNAADYQAIIINCAPLFNLLSDWGLQYEQDAEHFPWEQGERLRENLDTLHKQVLQIINSGRRVFALAVPRLTLQIPKNRFRQLYLDTYLWCPLVVETSSDEPGEVIRMVDSRLAEYTSQVRQWIFYFDDKPRNVFPLERTGLAPNQEFMQIAKPLFVNLSMLPLGIRLQYAVVDASYRGPQTQIDAASGPIYLLHYPLDGNLHIALRALLREFLQLELVETEEPDWLDSVPPPRGNDLDRRIDALSAEIDERLQAKERLLEEKTDMQRWQRLLYATGDDLEAIVLDALDLLGLENVRPGLKGDHDIAAELDGETLLFEVKGLTGSAGRKAVFALDRHREEFELKNPGTKVAKAILVANAFRELHPDLRDAEGRAVFPGDALDHAAPLEFALLDTRVLYRLVCDVLEGRLDDPAPVLRTLRNTTGIFEYGP